MGFQSVGNLNKLLVTVRQILFQTSDGLGCPDTRNNIFPLCINQVFTVNSPGSGRRISCKGNTGAGGVSHISKYHRLYVNRCSPVSGNIVHTAVYDGAFIIPGTENRFYSFHQLYFGILREIFSHLVLINGFKTCDNFLHIVRRQIRVKMSVLCFFDFIQDPLK